MIPLKIVCLSKLTSTTSGSLSSRIWKNLLVSSCLILSHLVSSCLCIFYMSLEILTLFQIYLCFPSFPIFSPYAHRNLHIHMLSSFSLYFSLHISSVLHRVSGNLGFALLIFALNESLVSRVRRVCFFRYLCKPLPLCLHSPQALQASSNPVHSAANVSPNHDFHSPIWHAHHWLNLQDPLRTHESRRQK